MGLPILPLFLILFIGYRTGVVVSPKLSLNYYHIVACTRRRTGGCGKSMRISLFSRPLRSTVTHLIKCSLQEQQRSPQNIPGTTVLFVPCSKHQYEIRSSRTERSCRMTSSQNAVYLRTKPGTDALPPARGMGGCLLYTSPSPRDLSTSRMPSSA